MKYLHEIRDYWDARANGFSSASIEELETAAGAWWRAFFQKEIASKSATILDCGTGAGFFTVILSELSHAVTAVDYSQEMLNKTKANLEARNLHAKLLVMDAQELQFPDNQFDVIVTRDLIWNLEKPERAYAEFARVLKPGGLLIVDDGNYYLHLHDESYAAIHKEKKKHLTTDHSCHERHNIDNVDMTIIEKIAEHLPLSSQRRPQWDFEQCIQLGFSRFTADIKYTEPSKETQESPANPVVNFPSRFLITAEK